MAYATYDDMIQMWGEIEVIRSSDRDGDDVADVGVVAKALEDEAATIDSYISAAYTLPIDPVPGVLKTHNVAMALYRMSLDGGVLTKEKRQRYEDCLRWLRDVASGKATLDGGGQDQPGSKGGGVRYFSEPREYTRGKLGGIL